MQFMIFLHVPLKVGVQCTCTIMQSMFFNKTTDPYHYVQLIDTIL